MSVSTSNDLPPVTPEQALLESVFLSLRQFAFDKAKDVVDKERESSQKMQVGSYWLNFLSQILNFISVERSYVTLVITPQSRGGFLKNLTPRLSYEKLRQEFHDMESVGNKHHQSTSGSLMRGSKITSSVEKLLAHLSGQLADYVLARSDMMSLYDKMIITNINKRLNYERLTQEITEILQKHQKCFHHPILSSIKSGFMYECEILKHLLQAQLDIAHHRFLPALLNLNECKRKITAWSPVTTAKSESWSLLPWGSTSPKRSSIPNLYQWLVSLKDHTVSKFTLYFYEVLSKQTNPIEMKTMVAKTSIDYIQKMSTFQRRHNIDLMCVVLDVGELGGDYRGAGYHHPNQPVLELTGLSAYPIIFSLPSEPLSHLQQLHWPAIIEYISSNKNKELGSYDSISFASNYHREHGYSSYFFTRLDQLNILIFICLDGRSEKDTHVNNFLLEISRSLRMIKLHSALRTK